MTALVFNTCKNTRVKSATGLVLQKSHFHFLMSFKRQIGSTKHSVHEFFVDNKEGVKAKEGVQ